MQASAPAASTSAARHLRRAEHRGRPAGECRALACDAPGPYMLAPHDDLAQLGIANQRGFEIQDVRRYVTMAVDMYISMPHTGGELRLWNLRPDHEFRRRFGVEDCGHPYPPDAIEGYPSIVVAVKPGDCLVLNGASCTPSTARPPSRGPPARA